MNGRHPVLHFGSSGLAAAAIVIVIAMALPAVASGATLQSFPMEVAQLASQGEAVAFSAGRPFENKADLWRSLPSGNMELALSPLFDAPTPHVMVPGNGVAFIAAADRVWRVPAQAGPIENATAPGTLTPLGSAGGDMLALAAIASGTTLELELVVATGAPLEVVSLGRVGRRGTSASAHAIGALLAHRGEWLFTISGSRATDSALDGIWATNGKVGGTRQIASAVSLCASPCRVERLASNGTKLFFSTREALWVLNPGLAPVRFATLGAASAPNAFVSFGDIAALGRYVFFAGRTANHGNELWFSDGTARGTRLFKSLRPGLASAEPEQLVAVGRRLFFIANDGVSGRELWTSNGTRAGTRRLSDIAAGAADGILAGQRLVGLPAGVVLNGSNAAHGAEPWASDGTVAGTTLLADVKPGPASSASSGFTAANGKIYFKGSGENGDSLFWVEHPAAGNVSTP